jgi:hypothetical protein
MGTSGARSTLNVGKWFEEHLGADSVLRSCPSKIALYFSRKNGHSRFATVVQSETRKLRVRLSDHALANFLSGSTAMCYDKPCFLAHESLLYGGPPAILPAPRAGNK